MTPSRTSRVVRVAACLARLYLGILFVAASYHKILDPAAFAVDVATYQFLPLSLINLTALVLPWVELGAGMLLIIGWKVRAAALLVSLMMLSFLVALAFALRLGLEMSCGCFASQGAAHDPISGWTLLRDGAWLCCALFVLVFDKQPMGLDSLWPPRSQPHDR